MKPEKLTNKQNASFPPRRYRIPMRLNVLLCNSFYSNRYRSGDQTARRNICTNRSLHTFRRAAFLDRCCSVHGLGVDKSIVSQYLHNIVIIYHLPISSYFVSSVFVFIYLLIRSTQEMFVGNLVSIQLLLIYVFLIVRGMRCSHCVFEPSEIHGDSFNVA